VLVRGILAIVEAKADQHPSARPGHEHTDRLVLTLRDRDGAHVGMAIFREFLNEVSRDEDSHSSGSHEHPPVRQKVDPVDSPAILSSAATFRIPRVGVRLRRQQQKGECRAHGDAHETTDVSAGRYRHPLPFPLHLQAQLVTKALPAGNNRSRMTQRSALDCFINVDGKVIGETLRPLAAPLAQLVSRSGCCGGVGRCASEE